MGDIHFTIHRGVIFLLLFLGVCKSNSDTKPGNAEVSISEKTQKSKISGEGAHSTISNSCITKGGKAVDSGLKVWCWEDIILPEYSGSTGVSFSQKEFYINSECSTKQVTNDGNRLRFFIDPFHPEKGDWCDQEFNMRAEISTAPWPVRHKLGTEEWFGWNYRFEENYIIDKVNSWLFFQIHHGVKGSPPFELLVSHEGQYKAKAGEIVVQNNANYPDNILTGIIPKAGEGIDVVVHIVYGDEVFGKLEVWINGSQIVSKSVRTVYEHSPWGGNAKWGIYKWPWREESGIQKSLQQGIQNMETTMGTLRMLTKTPDDPDYGKDAYFLVAPR